MKPEIADTRKNIAIVGAGFGGLRAALLIGRAIVRHGLTTRYRVLLVDQNDYHTYTPTLYEAATNDPKYTSYQTLREIITIPLASLIGDLPIDVITTLVERVDLKKNLLICDDADPLPFHYLVLAPGSEPHFFDIPGLQEHAIPLKTFRDSIAIREYILTAIQTKTEPVHVVIGGGGSAGVEVAGEVREWLNKLQYQSSGNRLAHVSIIETAQTVLSPFPKNIIECATKRLTRLGVKLITNERINSVSDKQITLATGKAIPFDICIWTGGVKPNQLMATLPLLKDQRGLTTVSATLECEADAYTPPLSKKIFALGDAIVITNPKTGKPVAGTARAALSQADVVANNLIEDIKLHEGVESAPRFMSYQPKSYPYIIPIGGKYAIAYIGGITISGFLGWLLKGVVELRYLWSLMSLKRALRLCMKGFWIIIKNDRSS